MQVGYLKHECIGNKKRKYLDFDATSCFRFSIVRMQRFRTLDVGLIGIVAPTARSGQRHESRDRNRKEKWKWNWCSNDI